MAQAGEFDPKIPLSEALKRSIEEWQKGNRRARNLKQLAKVTQVSYQTICSIARGTRAKREPLTVLRITRHIFTEEKRILFLSIYWPDLLTAKIDHLDGMSGSAVLKSPKGSLTNAGLISDVKVYQAMRRVHRDPTDGGTFDRDVDIPNNRSDLTDNAGNEPPFPEGIETVSGSTSLGSDTDSKDCNPGQTTTPGTFTPRCGGSTVAFFGKPPSMDTDARLRYEAIRKSLANTIRGYLKGRPIDYVVQTEDEIGVVTASGHLKQEACVLASISPELQSFLRREHGERGLLVVCDSWSHRLRYWKPSFKKNEQNASLLSWTYRKKYRSKLSAPLASTGSSAVDFVHRTLGAIPDLVNRDEDKKIQRQALDPLGTGAATPGAIVEKVAKNVDSNSSGWKTLAIILFFIALAAMNKNDTHVRIKSGSFEVKTYRVEDEYFAPYEQIFPNFPRPFAYDGREYRPIKLNSVKGILCLESVGDRQDLILHKRSALQYLDDEEITLHDLKTCFE